MTPTLRILPAAFLAMLCLGNVYAWSLFVPYLIAQYGLSHQQSQLIFGTLIAVYSLTMVFNSGLLKRHGIRWMLRVSSLLFLAGYGLAVLSQGQFAGLFTGIGLIAGMAVGFGYTSIITTCMRWFPNNKATVTGLIVAGFGGGALVLTTLFAPMLKGGMDVLHSFGLLGLFNALIVFISSCLLKDRSNEEGPLQEVSPAVVLKQPTFWSLFVGMLSGTFAGFLMIGNLTSLIAWTLPEQTVSLGVIAVSVLAVGNALGRVSSGLLVQRFQAALLPMIPLLTGLSVLTFPLMQAPWSVILLTLCIGWLFGANFVIYASELARRFGVSAVQRLYPVVLIAQAIAALSGPVIAGVLFDQTASFQSSLTLASGLALVGAIAMIFLERKALFAKYPVLPA